MKCRDDMLFPGLQLIEQNNCFSRSFDFYIDAAYSNIFQCLLRHRHHTRVAGSNNKDVGADIESIGNIFRAKSVSFFSPPSRIHPVAINDNVRPVGLPVYYNMPE